MTDEAPITARGGSAPPLERSLVAEMQEALGSLISTAIGDLREDIIHATTAASQVAEQLGRFNNNVELLQGQMESALLRMTAQDKRMDQIESRVARLEGHGSNPPDEAA